MSEDISRGALQAAVAELVHLHYPFTHAIPPESGSGEAVRTVCHHCRVTFPCRTVSIINSYLQPPLQPTELGEAVIESGLTVRQHHELTKDCTTENPCDTCRKWS